MRRINYKRHERKAQIIETLKIRADKKGKPEATHYQIAKSLELSPSMFLLTILAEMVADGQLTVREVKHGSNHWKSIYSLPDGVWVPKTQTRELLVNGQMVMF